MSGTEREGGRAPLPSSPRDEGLVKVCVVQSVWGYNRTTYWLQPEHAARLQKRGGEWDDEAWETLWDLEEVDHEFDEEDETGYLEVVVLD